MAASPNAGLVDDSGTPSASAIDSGGTGVAAGARRTGALTEIDLHCVAEMGLFDDSVRGHARACSVGPMTLSVAPDGDCHSPYHVRILFGAVGGSELGAGSSVRLLGFTFNDIKQWGFIPDSGVIYLLLNRPLGNSLDLHGRWRTSKSAATSVDDFHAIVAKARPGSLCVNDPLRSLRVNTSNPVQDLPSCIAEAWQQICSEGSGDASPALAASVASATASTGGLRRSRRSSTRTRFGGSSAAASDVVHLVYTAPGSRHAQSRDTITIYSGDLDRLNEGEFLNDSLVDFWLKHYHVEPEQLTFSDLPLRERRDMYVFSSYFFTKLRDGAGVVDVDRWADKLPEFDLFAKKLLFVPINESLHWSLAIVVNPCSLAEGKPDARIMVLDSLCCHKPKKVVKLLRTYLFHEWRKREDKDKKAKASQASRCQGADGSDRDGDECERWNEHEFNRLLPLETVNNVSVLHWCFLFLCAALTSMLWLCPCFGFAHPPASFICTPPPVLAS